MSFNAKTDRRLLHPELQHLSDAWLSFAASSWNFFLPRAKQIHWYGGAIRSWPGGDGGQGAYLNDELAAKHPMVGSDDIQVGPF